MSRLPLHQSQPSAATLMNKIRHNGLNNNDWASSCPPDICERLVSLSELNSKTLELWQQSTSSTPYLLDPSRCWQPVMPAEVDLWIAVSSVLRSKTNYDVFKDGRKMQKLSSSSKRKHGQDARKETQDAAATAMFQSQKHTPFTSLSTIFNVQLEDFSAVLKPPETARCPLHVCEEKFQIAVNVVPSGGMVDLHHGESLVGYLVLSVLTL